MLIVEVLVRYFDFRKDENLCNVLDCENYYYHELTFHEFDLRASKERELAKVRICKEHENLVRKLLKKMNKHSIKNRKVIKAKISQG